MATTRLAVGVAQKPLLALTIGLLHALGCPAALRAQEPATATMPTHLPPAEGEPVAASEDWVAAPSAWDDPSYRGLLTAGYLLGIPSAFMTGGVGVLLPVGMHYYNDNPDGGLRALLGIVSGVAVGGLIGGLADPPEDGFSFTRGMLGGMVSGYFLWGIIDVAFFAETEAPDGSFALDVQLDWQGKSAGLRVAGAL